MIILFLTLLSAVLATQVPIRTTPIRVPDTTIDLPAVRTTNAGSIWGRVTIRETNEAVEGITVHALRKSYNDEGVLQTIMVSSATTGTDGTYRVSVPNSGQYYVATSAGDSNQGVYMPLYYPNSPDEIGARQIQVPLGGDVGAIDFSVSPAKRVSIRGRLIDGLGRRLPHWDWVWLVPRRFSEAPARIRPTGGLWSQFKLRFENSATFEINNVVPGAYYLCSYRFDDIEKRAETVIPIVVPNDDLNVDIVSAESYDVSGRIRFEGQRLPLTPAAFRIVARLASDPTSVVTQQANILPNTTFSFPPLPSGEFHISILDLPPSYFVKSVRIGQVDLLETGLTLQGTDPGLVEVVLSNNGSQLTGRVLDSEQRPAARSYVVLIPDRKGLLRPDLYKLAVSDANGQFRFAGVAPGNYKVYAWKQLSPGAYFDPAFMKLFAGQGMPVQLTTESISNVTLQRIDVP